MNRRIGILTLSSSNNCGSLLQAYALRHFLITRFKVDAFIINFTSQQSIETYKIRLSKRDLFRPKRIVNFFLMKKHSRNYETFRRKKLNIKGRVYNGFASLQKKFRDCSIIVGSDQVWNVKMFDFDEAFFLKWAKKQNKIAYAPSLGSCKLQLKYSKEYLFDVFSSFNFISSREDGGAQQISDILNKKIDVLLDPTLLLERNEWEVLCGKKMMRGDYIFYYSWAYEDEELNRIVQRYAKENKINVVVINAFKWTKRAPRDYDFILFKESGPIAFLNLMMYAKKVFVQSFHGIIFARIFEKDFFLLDKNDEEHLDYRLNQVLKMFNKSDRIVRKYDDIARIECQNNNFNCSSEFETMKAKSISFLKKAIDGDTDEL